MDYLKELKLSLLEAGGVDNWEHYEQSLSNYQDQLGTDELSPLQTLEALEQGGVDNWEWYDDSLEYYPAYVNYYEENYSNSPLPFQIFIINQKEKERELEELATIVLTKKKNAVKANILKEIEGLDENKVVHRELYEWLRISYPDLSTKKINIVYSNLLQINGPFQEQHGLFKEEFEKAKAYGLKKSTIAGDFFKYAGIKYIQLVIKNPKFKEFVDKVKNESSDELVNEIYKIKGDYE